MAHQIEGFVKGILLLLMITCPSVCFSAGVSEDKSWVEDINHVLTKQNDRINIGLIIETKIEEFDEFQKEQAENAEESQFFGMIEKNQNKYKVTGRRHLMKVLEEHGIAGSETAKLGKFLDLDIIVIREIYDGSKLTKVLKVTTGEALLVKTYGKKRTWDEGWVMFSASQEGGHIYYNKLSMKIVRPNVVKVWVRESVSKSFRDGVMNDRKRENKSTQGWENLDQVMYLLEVDCKTDVIYIFKLLIVNTEGEKLEAHDFPAPRTQPRIPNGDTFDLTFTKVCSER
jgi:hypothetical protein